MPLICVAGGSSGSGDSGSGGSSHSSKGSKGKGKGKGTISEDHVEGFSQYAVASPNGTRCIELVLQEVQAGAAIPALAVRRTHLKDPREKERVKVRLQNPVLQTSFSMAL